MLCGQVQLAKGQTSFRLPQTQYQWYCIALHDHSMCSIIQFYSNAQIDRSGKMAVLLLIHCSSSAKTHHCHHQYCDNCYVVITFIGEIVLIIG